VLVATAIEDFARAQALIAIAGPALPHHAPPDGGEAARAERWRVASRRR
jgi:hypothetical protein